MQARIRSGGEVRKWLAPGEADAAESSDTPVRESGGGFALQSFPPLERRNIEPVRRHGTPGRKRGSGEVAAGIRRGLGVRFRLTSSRSPLPSRGEQRY